MGVWAGREGQWWYGLMVSVLLMVKKPVSDQNNIP